MSDSAPTAQAPFEPPPIWTEWRPYGQFLDLELEDGVKGKCHYHLTGDDRGNVVVLVHGIGEAGGARFLFIRRALEEAGRRVLSFDFFGRGFSDCPEGFDFSGDAHVRQMRAVLVALQLDRAPVSLVGHSMGGAVSLMYTHAFPDHVRALALLAPAGMMNGGLFKCLACCCCGEGILRSVLSGGGSQERAIRDDFVDSSTAPMFPWMMQLERLHAANNAGRITALARSVRRGPLHGLRDVAARVARDGRKRRVLFLWGRADRTVPTNVCAPRYAAAVAGGDADVEAVVYDAGAHAFFMEESLIQEVNSKLVAFTQ